MRSFGRKQRLPEVGSRAPAFSLPLLGGGEAGLQELAARGPLLLVFFKISCPVCQLTLPYLERLHAAGALPIYAVSQNEAADTLGFNRHFKLTLPTLLDSEEQGFAASNAYGINHVPTSFLIAPDGTVERAIEGWNKAEFQAISPIPLFQKDERVPEWKAG